MAKNNLVDLHDILFEQLERLNDDDLMDDPEKAKKELERGKLLTATGNVIVNNAKLMLEADKAKMLYGGRGKTEINPILITTTKPE